MEFQYLLLLDTDKIKDYVFGSSKLKEIRGASMLLEHLNTIQTKNMILNYFNMTEKDEESNEKFRIVYLDGGSGKVEFSTEEDAVRCGELVAELYKKYTGSASISWEVVKINHQFYYQSVAQGEFYLRLKKQKGKNLGQLNHLGVVHRCSHSGYEMVENLNQEFYSIQNVERTYEKVSPKKDFAKIGPSSIVKQTFYENNQHNDQGLRKIIKEAYDSSFEWPRQLSVIGQAAGNGDIGLLYFDGNSMNKVLKNLKTAEEYQSFSDNLKSSIQESIKDTITAIFPDESLPQLVNSDEDEEASQKVTVLPLELILTAGDDIIMVVPSTKAMDFTATFLEKFSEKTKAKGIGQEGLTMSAGVAIAKSSFPIKYLVPLAEQLLRSAKKKNYELKQQGVTDPKELSTIDYMVVSMSSNPDLTLVRNEELSRKDGKWNYMLTKRPYTLNQWKQINGVIELMKQNRFPNSKMKAFYHLHFMDEWEGNYYYSKYFGNLNKELKGNLKELYHILYKDELVDSFWMKDDIDESSSPLIDLFEIYRYIEGGSLKCQKLESTMI